MKPSRLDEYLMKLPVDNPDRINLRDRYAHLDAKRLEARCRKFLSVSSEFATSRKPNWWMEVNAEPIYPAWTRSLAQSRPVPFESGKNVLPGLEKWLKQARGAE